MIDLGSRKAIASLSAFLCIVPTAIVGVSSDLFWWEWFTVVPVGILLLGMPQVMLFVVAMATKKRSTRISSLLISCVALAAYLILQLDIDPLSSSTASLSYLFLQLLILPFAGVAIGVVALLSPAGS